MAENKKKKTFPTAPSLIGDKIYLRAATANDMTNIQQWSLLSEPQSLGCHVSRLITPDQAAERFSESNTRQDSQDFAVVRKEDNILIGKASFFNLNQLNRSTELGLIVDPDEQKKGYGKAAMHLMCRYLFKQCGLNKVYAQTAEFNEGAIKLLESLGFKRDATLRDHYFLDGRFHAGLIYSLLLFEFE